MTKSTIVILLTGSFGHRDTTERLVFVIDQDKRSVVFVSIDNKSVIQLRGAKISGFHNRLTIM